MKVIIHKERSRDDEVLFSSEIDRYVVNKNGITDFILGEDIVISIKWVPRKQRFWFGDILAWVTVEWDDDLWRR